jgi:hypothetical protein
MPKEFTGVVNVDIRDSVEDRTPFTARLRTIVGLPGPVREGYAQSEI